MANHFARTRQKTACIVKKAYLLILCLAMDVLFLRALPREGNVFTESLATNAQTRHNTLTSQLVFVIIILFGILEQGRIVMTVLGF
jgi:hypothetical protein